MVSGLAAQALRVQAQRYLSIHIRSDVWAPVSRQGGLESAAKSAMASSPVRTDQTKVVCSNLKHTRQAVSSGSWYSGIFESLTQLQSLGTGGAEGFFIDRECAVERRASRGPFTHFLQQ